MHIQSLQKGVPQAAPSAHGAASRSDPARLAEAAHQFESLLVEQVLKSMRESRSGWLGNGDDESNAAVMQLGEEQLAQALSAAGGLGFGKLVISGLRDPK